MPTTTVVKHPSDAPFTFGTVSELGIAVESYEQNDTCDKYEQKNEVGEVIEVVTFNPRAEITISGQLSDALTKFLGTTLTIANLITTQCGEGGIAVVSGVSHSMGRAKNEDVRITATYYPLIVVTP
jgi:hypothetical protein